MNLQRRADERSKALHKEIAKKLRNNPGLWIIPLGNIKKWRKMRGGNIPALSEWEQLLESNDKERILSILESDSEDSIRLRSSSPFTGILSENEREIIFKFYKIRDEKSCNT